MKTRNSPLELLVTAALALLFGFLLAAGVELDDGGYLGYGVEHAASDVSIPWASPHIFVTSLLNAMPIFIVLLLLWRALDYLAVLRKMRLLSVLTPDNAPQGDESLQEESSPLHTSSFSEATLPREVSATAKNAQVASRSLHAETHSKKDRSAGCQLDTIKSNIASIGSLALPLGIDTLPVKKRWFWLAALTFLLCWIPFWLALWPGIFNYDAHYQYDMLVSGQLQTHHPLLHTLLLDGVVLFGEHILGEVNYGVALYIGIGLVASALTFSWMLYTMAEEGAGKVLLTGSFLFLAINPALVLWLVSTNKDVYFSLFVLLAAILLYRICGDRVKKAGAARKNGVSPEKKAQPDTSPQSKAIVVTPHAGDPLDTPSPQKDLRGLDVFSTADTVAFKQIPCEVENEAYRFTINTNYEGSKAIAIDNGSIGGTLDSSASGFCSIAGAASADESHADTGAATVNNCVDNHFKPIAPAVTSKKKSFSWKNRSRTLKFSLLATLFLLIFGVLAFRTSALFSIIIFLPFAALLFSNKLRYQLMTSLMSAVAAFLFLYVVVALLIFHIPSGPWQILDALSIPRQQLARVWVQTSDPEEIKAYEWVFDSDDLKELDTYEADNADPTRKGFLKAFQESPFDLLALYLKMGTAHPGIYLDAALLTTYEAWYPGAVIDGYILKGNFAKPGEARSSYIDVSAFPPAEEAWILEDFGYWLEMFGLGTIELSNAALRLLCSPATYLWILLIVLARTICTCNRRGVLVCVFLLAFGLTALLSPLVVMRYYLMIMIAAPLLFHLASSPVWRDKKQPETANAAGAVSAL